MRQVCEGEVDSHVVSLTFEVYFTFRNHLVDVVFLLPNAMQNAHLLRLAHRRIYKKNGRATHSKVQCSFSYFDEWPCSVCFNTLL